MSVYAWSDLHGNGKLFEKVMNYLNPEDKIFYLGDAIDRGPDGWQILKKLMNDPRVTFIPGNHEDMMLNAINFIKPKISDERDFEIYLNKRDSNDTLWLHRNGGEITFSNMIKDNYKNISNILQKLRDIQQSQDVQQLSASYVNKDGKLIIMTHSGFFDAELYETFGEIGSYDEIIWDRSQLLRSHWEGDENIYIIHGHSPVPYIYQRMEELNEWYNEERFALPAIDDLFTTKAFWYCDNHKCCIDLGTYQTETTMLLDLDTFNPIFFS